MRNVDYKGLFVFKRKGRKKISLYIKYAKICNTPLSLERVCFRATFFSRLSVIWS